MELSVPGALEGFLNGYERFVNDTAILGSETAERYLERKADP